MTIGKTDSNFSSLDYWRERHDQFKLNPTGVGNVAYSAKENEEIYDQVVRYFTSIIASLSLPPKARTLDLGCGIGKMTSAFVDNDCSYTGVDISRTAVEIARSKHLNSTYIIGNIAKLPFNNPFKVIFQRTVFIHLVEDEYWDSVLKEIKRLLDKDGIFIIQDYLPINRIDSPNNTQHVTRRLYSEYETAFDALEMKFDIALKNQFLEKVELHPNTHFVTHK